MHVHRWRWPRFGIKTLLAIPVVFAVVFYAITEISRVSPEQRWHIEHAWVRDPLAARFLPSEGATVRAGDPLLKVARIISKRTGHSWLVTEGRMIGDAWFYGFDAGGNPEMNPAPAGGLAQLSAYLKRLPPSQLVADTPNSLIIAYPSGGVWVVRRYRSDSVPKEANDIARLLDFHSSFDGSPIHDW